MGSFPEFITRGRVYLKPLVVSLGESIRDDRMLLKRHRGLWLPDDVIELILERLPMHDVGVFKSVSKKWKSTIDSRRFKERYLEHRKQSGGVYVLLMYVSGERSISPDEYESFTFGSSTCSTIRFPGAGNLFCYGSCDGIVCLYTILINKSSVAVNPVTGWHQYFPFSNCQDLFLQKYNRKEVNFPSPKPGFGKDKVTGTYKTVWLYNSSLFGLPAITTCELFDFSTNAWRSILPASPYQINASHKPVYLDGSLYWFTDCQQPKVLSLDLHTETFQVICKAPFAHPCYPTQLTMCILNNSLCVSEKKGPTQVIWIWSSGAWNQMCSIDLTQTFDWYGVPKYALSPIAILDKDKLLLQGRQTSDALVIHDLCTKSYDLLFKPTRPVAPVYIYESLFSAFSN